MADELLLLPTPRKLERLGGFTERREPLISRDPSLPAEGYRLRITPTETRLIAADDAGERHGRATLAQLPRQLPCLAIDDEPLFPIRGAMLDVSRDRIPTMAEFRRLIPQLASFKFNHLQLYVEHTVAYAGHEAAWRGLDPLTPEELRTLDDLCAAHGIELVANQNCFGHLSGFLKLPPYHHLAEIAVDGTWDFNGLVTRTGPFSLCPSEPGALPFVADLLGQLTPLIRSPWLNIGCDETFDIGQGRSRAAVASRGRAQVYLDFVSAVCAIAQRLGKRPQFWADIALEHPEALADLPADLCGLAWGYEGDAQFSRWVQQLTAVGREAWVCPGTSSWRSITGRTSDRRANLLAAVAAREHGAEGFLVTDWGDLGHRQQWPIALHGLAEAAHRAWSGDAPYDSRAAGLHAHGEAALGPWLDQLGDVDRHLRLIGGKRQPDGARVPLRNATALFTELHLREDYVGDAGTWRELDERLQQFSRAGLPRECAHALRVARFACARAVARRTGAKAPDDELRAIIAEHRELWQQRSRPGGLQASCSHYEALLENR